ncbi:MAG: threonine/serine dehydratase [Anaerolineae bacterium]|jgi:threonine dehydratase
MDVLESLKCAVEEAQPRIAPHVRRTPLQQSEWLSHACGCRVFLKLENLQHTGSFKVRGAFNSLLSLEQGEGQRQVVTGSSGNHGIAVAYAASRLGLRATVFAPETMSAAKADAIKRYGAQICSGGAESGEAERQARDYAERQEIPFISPYNNPLVVAGQGTIGAEILDQLPTVGAIFAPVGGGGLISGIAGYLKAHLRRLSVMGCQPSNSPAMAEAVVAGRAVETSILPTLSDGTAGRLEPGAITIKLCQSLVDTFTLVSEAAIREALRGFAEAEHMVIEGAAAVPVAALLDSHGPYRGQDVVVVISGANISRPDLATALTSTGVA